MAIVIKEPLNLSVYETPAERVISTFTAQLLFNFIQILAAGILIVLLLLAAKHKLNRKNLAIVGVSAGVLILAYCLFFILGFRTAPVFPVFRAWQAGNFTLWLKPLPI